jgi:putative ATP-dependent endonuclease of the OLD family
VALRELLVEGFRGIRSARLSLDPATTVLVGENDCGKSSLLEALALVLSPLGDRVPRVQPWQFHREGRDANAACAGPVRIQVTLGETAAGSWDRAELGILAPVLGRKSTDPRALVVELLAEPPVGAQPAAAHWEIRNPAGRGRRSRDDADALEAVRRLNPLVWLRGGALVRPAAPGAGEAAGGPADTIPDAALVLRSYERLLSGETPSHEGEIDSGYAAAERLLAEWAPAARDRRQGTRAAVADVLGRVLELTSAGRPPGASLPGTTAQKLGVLLLTAGLFQQLRAGAAPGMRPIIVIEEPEAGLHPMTLASVFGLLERLSAQKVVTTNSGTLLSAVPLRSLRRLVRDPSGVVGEWRVREGALRKDDLRKVSYHLRARRGTACFARCWLLVEGETEYWILPDLARLLGHDLVQEGVACVEFAQCGLGPLVKLARALGIEWHVLADGDRAGEIYSGLARSFLRGEEASVRISTLDDRDIEHCFWRHGHAPVFERLAGLTAGPGGASPRRVIEKAIDRHSKPGVAFELLAAVAAGPAGAPPPLRGTIETCVALARGAAPGVRPGANAIRPRG